MNNQTHLKLFAANLNSNFTIIDTDDQTRLIKNICKSENIDIKQLAPRFIFGNN